MITKQKQTSSANSAKPQLIDRIGLKNIDKKLLNVETMSNVRIIKKNLVYVIGLTKELASKNLLKQIEYFGQYGSILKVVINSTNGFKATDSKDHSYSAYITFSKSSEASLAILAVSGFCISNHCLKATYGITKLCTFYLKGKECTNRECMYLHTELSEHDDILEKDENTRINFKQQHLQAIKIANVFNFEVRKKLTNTSKVPGAIFPCVNTIYDNSIVYENDFTHLDFQKYLNGQKSSCATGVTGVTGVTNVASRGNLATPIHTNNGSSTFHVNQTTQQNNAHSNGLNLTHSQSNNSNQLNKSKDKDAITNLKNSKESNRELVFNKETSYDKLEKHDSIEKHNKSDVDSLGVESLDDKESNSVFEIDLTKQKSLEVYEYETHKPKLSISTSSDSTANEHNKESPGRLFKAKSSSRFSFVEGKEGNSAETSECAVEVPHIITKIIDNGLFSKSTKNFSNFLRIQILNNISEESKSSIEPVSDWVRYLLDNLKSSNASI